MCHPQQHFISLCSRVHIYKIFNRPPSEWGKNLLRWAMQSPNVPDWNFKHLSHFFFEENVDADKTLLESQKGAFLHFFSSTQAPRCIFLVQGPLQVPQILAFRCLCRRSGRGLGLLKSAFPTLGDAAPFTPSTDAAPALPSLSKMTKGHDGEHKWARAQSPARLES